jgi:hypothetical protein
VPTNGGQIPFQTGNLPVMAGQIGASPKKSFRLIPVPPLESKNQPKKIRLKKR